MTSEPSHLEKLKMVLLDNTAAIQFCHTFFRWCHWIDDVVDKDKDWEPDDTIRVNLEALVVFSDNEFFQRHKERLMPLIVQSARAHLDSIRWERREGVKDRRAADVFKSFYHEVIFHAGYLAATEKGVDAWDHLAEVTTKFREYDYDCKD